MTAPLARQFRTVLRGNVAIREGHVTIRYDEEGIAARVRGLPLSRRVLFACACAERLMPAYRWFCGQAAPDDFTIVRQGLDLVWSIARGCDVPEPPETSRWCARIDALDRSSDDGLPGSAVAENALACVTYALQAWATADPQQAVWAAQQVYEAADVVARQDAPAHRYLPLDELESKPPVQLLLKGMHEALEDAHTVDDLIARAQADGQRFLRFLTGAG